MAKPTKNADPTQDTLFREINEELRHEKLLALWKKYGALAIGGALALILSVAGYKGWQYYDIDSRTKQGERFIKARSFGKDGKREDAQAAFSELAENGRAGYALLSRLQQAALAAKAGDAAGAEAILAQAAANPSFDASYRDLATVLSVLHGMGGSDPAELATRLAPIMADANPWRYSAQELSAILALQQGDKEKARSLLSPLSADLVAPEGIRNRAAEILASIKKP